MCRGVSSCPWGSRGDGPGRGLVGFLWGTPNPDRQPSQPLTISVLLLGPDGCGRFAGPDRMLRRQLHMRSRLCSGISRMIMACHPKLADVTRRVACQASSLGETEARMAEETAGLISGPDPELGPAERQLLAGMPLHAITSVHGQAGL